MWVRSASAVDELPLAPLMAAHARSSAEGLTGEDNLVASAYSDQLAASYETPADGDYQ